MGFKIGGNVIVASLLGTVALVAVPAPAMAATGTVTVSGSVVTVTGTELRDVITIHSADAARHIGVFAASSADGQHELMEYTAGAGCTADGPTYTITCELASAATINISVGDAVDTVTVDNAASPNTRVVTMGGPGGDYLYGGPAIEEWYGEDGTDVIHTDNLQVGPDLVRGGPGYDEVYFSATSMNVTLDDQANDTSSADPALDTNDIGSDIESVFGTAGDDTLTGNDLRQTFDGLGGNDTIIGLGGDDTLVGDIGNDRIAGGRGRDQLFGGDGDDAINAVDGERDEVLCQAGSDAASVDDIDVVNNAGLDVCETLAVTNTSPPSPPGPPAAAASISTMTGRVLRVNRKGTSTRLPLECSTGATTCTGRIRLSHRRATLGKGGYSLAAGDRGKVKILLTRKGRVALRKWAKVRVVATLVPDDGVKSTRRYVLKR
jgi:hypothetical protein